MNMASTDDSGETWTTIQVGNADNEINDLYCAMWYLLYAESSQGLYVSFNQGSSFKKSILPVWVYNLIKRYNGNWFWNLIRKLEMIKV